MADEVTVDSKTGADIISAVTAQRKLAEASGQVAENIAQSFEQVTEVFQKTNKAVSELGGTFTKLFGDINSVNDIPLIGTIEDIAMSVDKRIGVAVKALLIAAETMNKIDSAFVDLKRSSVITGAAFGQSSMEVERYAKSQMATLGRLSQTLSVHTEEFNKYQEVLRKTAFSYRDMDTMIQAWGPKKAIVDHMFAMSKGLGMEFSTVLKDFEDLTLRAGHATGDFAKNATTTAQIYRGFSYSANRLGITVPYLREEIMKSVSGHWASITNIENRAMDLRLNYEKFYMGLQQRGQEGLAGDFLAKVQTGLTGLSSGNAAWLLGASGGGTMADVQTFFAQIREASGQGKMAPALLKIKTSMQKYFGSFESVPELIAQGVAKNDPRWNASFVVQSKIQEMFHVNEGEAQNLIQLVNSVLSGKLTAEEKLSAEEKIKNVFDQGQGIAQQQLTTLQNIAINVKGLFLHWVYGKNAEDLLEKNLKTTAETFEKQHLADKEAKLKRPLSAVEKQNALSEARSLWVSLREMVAVGAIEPDRGSIEDALAELMGKGTVSSTVTGARGAARVGSGGSPPGTIRGQYGETRIDSRGRRYLHSGIDISGKEGTVFPSPVTGIATYHPEGFPGYKNMGNTVSVITGNEEHVFGHLSGIPDGFKNGPVNIGEPIGLVGSTGRSTGPHIHYEVRSLDSSNRSRTAGGRIVTIEPPQNNVLSLRAAVSNLPPRISPTVPKLPSSLPTSDVTSSSKLIASNEMATNTKAPSSQMDSNQNEPKSKGPVNKTTTVNAALIQTKNAPLENESTGGTPGSK